MHASERDLLEARSRDALGFSQHVVNRYASRPAACGRNDAVRALLRASSLNAQRKRGPPGDTRLERRAAAALSVAEPLGCREVRPKRVSLPSLLLRPGKPDAAYDGNQLWLFVVGDAPRPPGQIGNLLGPPCGVAAGDDDVRGRIDSGDPPDRLPRRLVGARRHGTRIDADNRGLPGLRSVHA